MHRTDIPLDETGQFSDLILGLVAGKEELNPFHGPLHELGNYGDKMRERAALSIDREVLVESLLSQYASLGGAQGKVLENIHALRGTDTFTVTTGHQLNIFTGPLYFVFKILHAIRLAEKLCEQYPNNRFVPVFWMATEDHDLAEIAFFHLFGKRYEWNTAQTGATGRMTTEGLLSICDELEQVFEGQEHALSLVSMFREAYAHDTLANATRHIANALFGKYGLVVVDADRPELKALFREMMVRDALEQTAYKAVSETSSDLQDLGHAAQVTPREINLFYMQQGSRKRIVHAEGGLGVLDADIHWSAQEFRDEVAVHPERFSPNVVLRPMYQEHILPNLAYVGGAGELAYWLQLKNAFVHEGIGFPILVLRNHLLLLDANTQKRMTSLGLMAQDLFQPLHELVRAHVADTVDADLDLSHELKLMSDLYDGLKARASEIDASLVGALDAELAKQQKAISQWNDRFARVLKKKHETAVQQIGKLHEKLFPNGSLQERHDNLLQFIQADADLLTLLYEAMEPFSQHLGVIELGRE